MPGAAGRPFSIFALDLGVRSGFAFGKPGTVPTSGVVRLKQPGEPIAVAFANLLMFLAEKWEADRPSLVVKEAPLPLQAFATLGNAAATVRATYGLHAVAELACERFDIECRDVVDSTVRKYLLGKGRLGTREETKRAVVDRCHVLGMLARDRTDDNQADAVAAWLWASGTLAGRPLQALHLFGERASA